MIQRWKIRLSRCRIARIDIICDQIPAETKILEDRYQLKEKIHLSQQIFEVVITQHKANSMATKQGTIVDTILMAASSFQQEQCLGISNTIATRPWKRRVLADTPER